MPFRFLTAEKHHRHTSLFGEILDWLLAPLLILWPLSMAIEYSLAYSIASTAYDRELRDHAIVLSRHVVQEDGQIRSRIFKAAEDILRADQFDDVFYQVRGPENQVIAGDPDLPAVEFSPDLEPGIVYYRDDVFRNREIRAAYLFAQIPGITGAILVQVAETDLKRSRLASDIIGGVLAAQFILLPVALLLVSFGLSKGMQPLNDLTDKVRGRRPSDLSPVDPLEAPEEVRPFLHSINDLMSRLDQSLRAQQRFVADAAHQMRTPLAGLKTQAELALRQIDAADAQHAIQQIAVGADRASRLVSQLLALARAESDTPPGLERIDIDIVVRDATRDWVTRAMKKRIDIGFESAGVPCLVDGNPILLREMLNNLIENAITYTPEGGRVTARVRAGDAIAIEIEDNGIGIDPSDSELVFERFYRVLGSGAEGTGLGLAIVRSIAEAHFAGVTLMPARSGAGTVARVVLPRSRASTRPLRTAD